MGPRAFVQIGGRSLLAWAVDALSDVVGRILIAVPDDAVERARLEVGQAAEIYPGASTRQETVRGLLKKPTNPSTAISAPSAKLRHSSA